MTTFKLNNNYYIYNNDIFTFDKVGTKIQEGGYCIVKNTPDELIYDYIIALPNNGKIINNILQYNNGLRYPVFSNERELCLNSKSCNDYIFGLVFTIDIINNNVLYYTLCIIKKDKIINNYINDTYNNIELSLEQDLLKIIKSYFNFNFKINKSLTDLYIVENLLSTLKIGYMII
jgi:hypothetical protein